jgi:membrane-associated phospholipid phosphatase
MFYRSTCRSATSVLLVYFVLVSSLSAQSLPEPQTEPVNPHPSGVSVPTFVEKDLFSKGWAQRLLKDQGTIWSSPSRIKASDAKWLAPLAGTAALTIARDKKFSDPFNDKPRLQSASVKFGRVGVYAPYAVPGAFLAMGKLFGKERLADTGKRGFEAAVYSSLTAQTLKLITNRTRPYKGGDGSFWTGGNSFPSGHAMHAWAMAKVVSDSYPEEPLVRFGMYGFATAMSVSRVTAQRHFVSDILIGSAIGYLIGKFVMRKHKPAIE